jgi:16S rRNA (adenine1518-N6/adenine1519-N6)-dimethyltransferase
MPSMDEERYFKTIAEYKLLAKHEVGQNFLIDAGVAHKIIELASLQKGDKVLEIGSGAGSLSYFIAASSAESDLIDIDEALVLKLQSDFKNQVNVHPQMGNVMRFDLAPYDKIIGNLPYYITSGILERILLTASRANLAVLMVQKEVVARLTAPIGNEDYGPLPILLRYRAELSKGFVVPRTAFSPAPHVDSAVFLLRFRPESSLKEANALYSLVGKLFLHRRKTILNNLETVVSDPLKAKAILEKAAIVPTRRPEDLSLEDYRRLLSQLY